MTLKAKIYGILSMGWAFFIFSNSIQVGMQSEARSGSIMEKISSVLHAIGFKIDTDLLHLLVRKSAHLTAFFILGLLISLFFLSQNKNSASHYGSILFFCLAVGVTDEFIQGFVVGRSSEVFDIIIDFSGACSGVFLIFMITKLKKHKFKYKMER